jgi:hypothetical protein
MHLFICEDLFTTGAEGKNMMPHRARISKNKDLKIRNQKSEIRNQKSEIRNQKSEIRNQKSEIRNQKSEIRNGNQINFVGTDNFFDSLEVLDPLETSRPPCGGLDLF